MRFRVLGPVRMSPRTPSAAKPRAVLATLLMNINAVVSTHTLIDELWSTGPPRTAATTLQVYVSQLRKALLEGGGAEAGRQPLLTRPPGYLIEVAADDLDLTVFESLRTEGRAAYARRDYDDASHLLGRALGLWTGPALSGIPHGPSLETSAIRLGELRAEVLEQRISADLRLGRHQELVGELMALAHEHPLRETLHCHLMVALYRVGRQSDALRVYQQARRSLVEELGVEPGPVLSRLLERVLASDPSLAWRGDPAVGGSRTGTGGRHADAVDWLPPALADFAGRTDQLAVGTRFLSGRASGLGRVLALAGRAGSGKTTLAVQLAHEATGLFPDGRILVTLRDAGGRAMEPGGVMAALLRRLRGPAAPEAAGRPPASEAELADLLHGRTEGRKLLLLLDDAVSEAQVRPVLSAAPDATVIVTSRRALGALDGVQHFVLEVLSRQDAEQLLVACGGPRMSEDPEAVSEIALLCGNLPLALRVAAAGLAARPHWTAAGLARRLRDERTRLAALRLGDLDVRSSLLTAYQDVGEEERHTFRALGLAPLPDFALWSAAALLGTDLPTAERRTEELVRAHLLEGRRRPGRLAPVRYGFHSLLRALALEVQAAEDVTHGARAAATERLCRAFLSLARHADAQLAPGRDLLVFETEPLAGVSPETLVGTAPLLWFQEEATGLLEAVRQAHAAGLWQLCCALASASAGYYEANALWDDWESGHELALDAARRAGDAHAEAVVLRSLGDLAWQRHQSSLAIDRYRLARHLFTGRGDRLAADRCLSGEADVLLGLGRAAHAGQGYAGALPAGRADDDARGAAQALRGLALVALREGRPGEALGLLGECETAAGDAGDERWREYARRTAASVRAAVDAGGDAEQLARMPLEVRPGVWLFVPAPAVRRAA
ncbi:AfsR/SARP family transcriptional regulator [Streptomyces enissocaesilis]|uniref:AfsR/SARP family transcriptional regulator n=1 Tax=Streptomyces enissocaesilis TaxID=332589 RepID=UPI0031D96D31